MLMKNLILTSLVLVLTATQALSFQNSATANDYELPRNNLTIQESHYSCFQTLQCLKKENPFKNSNLNQINFHSGSSATYVIDGRSDYESIHAVYDNKGFLVKATVIQRNILLPRSISQVLISDDYAGDGWVMIANELEIKNFDEKTMQFKVVLNRDDEVRVEYFDRYGNSSNRFI